MARGNYGGKEVGIKPMIIIKLIEWFASRIHDEHWYGLLPQILPGFLRFHLSSSSFSIFVVDRARMNCMLQNHKNELCRMRDRNQSFHFRVLCVRLWRWTALTDVNTQEMSRSTRSDTYEWMWKIWKSALVSLSYSSAAAAAAAKKVKLDRFARQLDTI